MTYHGGAIQDAPQVYVVWWGTQRVGQWFDDSAASPQSPTQSDFASEAIKAAQYFGVSGPDIQPVGSSGVDPSNEGVTLAGGHEYAETLPDPVPDSGWITDNDTTGGETAGDQGGG
ncbi:hypothetical protein [Streptomyces sp. NPDC002537]